MSTNGRPVLSPETESRVKEAVARLRAKKAARAAGLVVESVQPDDHNWTEPMSVQNFCATYIEPLTKKD